MQIQLKSCKYVGCVCGLLTLLLGLNPWKDNLRPRGIAQNLGIFLRST